MKLCTVSKSTVWNTGEQACDGHERTTDSYGREKKVTNITDFILKEPLFDNRNGGKDG